MWMQSLLTWTIAMLAWKSLEFWVIQELGTLVNILKIYEDVNIILQVSIWFCGDCFWQHSFVSTHTMIYIEYQ